MTLEYAIRIERLAESDGGGYLATVLELPGGMSDGATPEKAQKKRSGSDYVLDRAGARMKS
jgi:predicted RNase H-like HicB family nuclease